MQKTKLILKAKAHGAYNKAKKMYISKVKQQSLASDADRLSDRLRNERDVLASFVEFFESFKRAVLALGKEGPRRHESMGAVAQALSRLSPQLTEQPVVAFMLDTCAASVEGMMEGFALSGHPFEQVLPSLVDGFLSTKYADARAVLQQYDRCGKQLAESQIVLNQLKAQPKTDVGAIHRQESVVQQHVADLDALEDRAYDMLFKTNEDAQAALLRCVSVFLRAWSQCLQAAATALNEALEALETERAQCPDLAELSLPPRIAANGGGGDHGGAVGSTAHAPLSVQHVADDFSAMQLATPPRLNSSTGGGGPGARRLSNAIPVRPPAPQQQQQQQQHEADPFSSSNESCRSPAVSDGAATVAGAANSGVSSRPTSSYGKSVGAPRNGTGGGGGPLTPGASRPRPPAGNVSTLDGEAALDMLMAQDSGKPAPSAQPSFFQPSAPQPMATVQQQPPPAAQQSRGRPSSMQLPSPALSHASASAPALAGRQRVERKDVASANLTAELKEYSGPVYRALAPAESPAAAVGVRDFAVRPMANPKRIAMLNVNVPAARVMLDGVATSTLLTHHKSLRHPQRLVLTTARGKEKFEFASFEERERCWELLWQLRGIPVLDAVTIYTTTFNLGEARMPETLEGWLPEGYDLYAVGVQECEYIPHRQHDSVEADLFDAVSRHLGDGFCKVAGVSLLSIRLLVMVRRAYLPFVTNVKMHRVPCGHLGKVGNKGAAAVALHLLNTRLCFVTAHLAAHDEKYDERNSDLIAIAQGMRALVPPMNGPQNFYHGLFLFGDLNYRIELPRAECLARIADGNTALLLSRDQLGRAMREGAALYDFQEPPITFAPTYRVLRGREGYSEEKMRVPSWTDRVLWRALPAARVRVGAYSSCPSVMTSDHRPVFAAFQVGLFKPNLPHGRVRCVISVTQLRGELATIRTATSLVVSSWSLMDPQIPCESVLSYNAQWGDSIPSITPVSHNPSYVSARHLMLSVRNESRQVVATGTLPLQPACMTSMAFTVHMHDERGLYAGSVSGVLAVKFAATLE